jgi:hypothetical protein
MVAPTQNCKVKIVLGGLSRVQFRIICAELITFGFLLALAALSPVFFSATCQGQDGMQLFHKMQTALGGADKIAAIQDFDQCVRADSWDNDGTSNATCRGLEI